MSTVQHRNWERIDTIRAGERSKMYCICHLKWAAVSLWNSAACLIYWINWLTPTSPHHRACQCWCKLEFHMGLKFHLSETDWCKVWQMTGLTEYKGILPALRCTFRNPLSSGSLEAGGTEAYLYHLYQSFNKCQYININILVFKIIFSLFH